MADFRGALYGRYVSAFKGEASTDAEAAYAWWDHKYLPLLNDLDRGAPMLEIGCGSGRLLAYLAARGFSNARGVDVSDEQVRLARDRGVRAEQADAVEYLRERREAFQAIVAVDVLEHLTRAELLELAGVMQQALQPGGRVLIQTANGAGLFARQVIYGDLTHLTVLTPESLGQLLRGVGLERLAFYETGPIPIRVRGKLDVALWWAIKGVANAVRTIEAGKRQRIWTENFICVARKRS